MNIVLPVSKNRCSSHDLPISRPVVDKLLEYGPCELYTTPSNGLIISLPTRMVPPSHLYEENWGTREIYGNTRNVIQVRHLIDGTETGLIIKSPERRFRRSLTRFFWWGGERSGEKPIFVPNNPAVEEQSVWEAIFLLELAMNKIRGEIPQAILINRSGEHNLVVKRIEKGLRMTEGPTLRDIKCSICNLGIIPIDLDWGNIVINKTGYLNVIDTNRWYWAPYTETFIQRALEAIKQELDKEKR